MAPDQNDLVYITVTVAPVGDKELYLKQSVISLTDPEDGESELGSVSTTAGLGGDMILMEWKGRKGKVRMSEILRRWIESFDADGARRIPTVGPRGGA